MKIAHCSDTHLGYRALKRVGEGGVNQRSADVRLAFLDAVASINRWGPDLVIHSGDLFDRPRPSWTDIGVAISGFNQLDAPAVVIAGNHDSSTLRTKDDVFTVLGQACPQLKVVSGSDEAHEEVEFGGEPLHLHLVPSRKLRSGFPPVRRINPEMLNILVVHGIASDIPGARHEPLPGEEQIADNLLSRDYDYIAMGDWHRSRQVRPNAYYAGSTERFGWGDKDAHPGWLQVEVVKGKLLSVHHAPINTRPLVDLEPVEVAGRSEEEVMAVMMANLTIPWRPDADALVRQVVTGVPSRAFGRAIERVMTRFAENLPVASYSVRWSIRDAENNSAFSAFGAEIPTLDIPALFAEYVAAQPYKDEPFGERFLAQGAAALDVAARQLAERGMTDE